LPGAAGNKNRHDREALKNVMKTTDLITMATVALGAVTLTLAIFWSGPLGAGVEGDTLPPRIEKPRLVSHGIEFTLATAEARVFGAGDQPVFELTAVNTTDAPATGSVCATMTASSPADMMSRVLRMPAILWQTEQIVSLKARERKVLTLTATTNLPPKSIISVSLRGALLPGSVLEQPRPVPSVVALTFSTGTPPIPAALASLNELFPIPALEQ
jgi:hypothetical protein